MSYERWQQVEMSRPSGPSTSRQRRGRAVRVAVHMAHVCISFIPHDIVVRMVHFFTSLEGLTGLEFAGSEDASTDVLRFAVVERVVALVSDYYSMSTHASQHAETSQAREDVDGQDIQQTVDSGPCPR